MWQERIIGSYTEGRPGPLFVVSAAVHGNEHAGVAAVERLVHLLKLEAINNPRFRFYGKFLGFVGNVRAYKSRCRFIDTDLNRIWGNQIAEDTAEYQEMGDIKKLIDSELAQQPAYLLDLHTTSSPRGIFVVPCHTKTSNDLALQLHCPVITNVIDQLQGSMIDYFSRTYAMPERRLTCLAFEAGQHDKPVSVSMSVAAMVNCMRAIGCVDASEVEGKHDDLLEAYAEGLPQSSRIVYKYLVKDAALFEMLPGFEGFQKISEGQLLALDNGEEVFAPMDGRLLMPLYQKQGNEGFFIVVEEQSTPGIVET